MRQKLHEFGLTDNEARAYIALLRFGRQSPADLATRAEVSRGRVYQVLNEMCRKGFATEIQGPKRSFIAVDPTIALADILDERRTELQHTESLFDDLLESLRAIGAPRVPDLPAIEVLGRPDQVSNHFQQLQRDAQKEILVFNKPPYIKIDGNAAELEALARGVRCASVYERGSIQGPSMEKQVQEFVDAGEEVRFVDVLPMKLAVFDRRRALLPMKSDDPAVDHATVVVHDAGLAMTLAAAFDYYFDIEAVPRQECEKRLGGSANHA